MVSESRTIDLLPLACLTEIARLRGVTAAADALGLSKSAVSKHLSRLEARLGVKLVERSSRRVQLTAEGQALLPRIESLLAESDLLFEQARSSRSEPAGLVRIAATPEFGAHLAEHFVPTVLARYPGLRVAMTADYRFEDLQNPSYDLAFRIGSVNDEGLVARCLGAFRRVLVAGPGGAPKVATPEDLATVPSLTFSARDTRTRWTLVHTDDERSVEVEVGSRQSISSFTALARLCRAGLGVALLPDFLVMPDLATGALVRVLPDWQSPPTPVYLVHRVGAERIQRIKVVLEAAREQVPGRLLGSATQEQVSPPQ